MIAMNIFRDTEMADYRLDVDLRTNLFSRMPTTSPLTMNQLLLPYEPL